MSFPNSGTTYTNHLIQEYTKTTTATNYGKEQSEKAASIPVLPGLDLEGPYFRYPTWEKPPTYILTKTHCASSTNDMPLHVIDSVEAFEITCSSGSRLEVYNGTTAKIPATYSPSLVKRAVHLIRNPFDNVVARFHMKINNWKAKNYHNDSISSNIYNSTSEGFKAYCQFRDKPFSKLKWNSTRIFGPNIVRQYELAKLLKDLPCYEQFVYYIRWHNFAMEMLQRKGIPVLTLFYEDYSLRFEDTVKGLLNFLSLTPAKDTSPPEFFPGKQYLDFYEPSEREAAKRLMLGLANKELNLLLQRYLVA
ncbi:sulfotransferase family protein [Nitzschia inconspicua]|uniref:Sulfotransferase family protein n=1 Tax=Nitzschia inconspicua TaxID=303405 RepID=A0A9K3LW74_9STRA|nr:sulfotransferase family protein [Nitzschia inconspicua]